MLFEDGVCGVSPPSPHPLRCWERGGGHLNKTNSSMCLVSRFGSSKLSRRGGPQRPRPKSRAHWLCSSACLESGWHPSAVSCLTETVGYMCFIQNALQEAAGLAFQSF